LDLFDGYVARRSGHVTRLGEKLDLDLDVRGMLLGSVLAVQFGTAAWWYLLVGIARHIYVAAIRLRQRLGLPVFEKPNRFSRPLAGLQMGVSTALLAPTLYAPYTILISTLVMAIFLSNFLMDWLTIGTRKPFVLNTSHDLIRLLPLGLRIAIFILAASQAVAGATFTLALVVAAFLLLGVGTRASALVLLIQIGLAVGSSGMDLVELVTVICSLGLVYLGPGSLFLWAPENILVRRRLGEQRVK
jgi:hypothetical protein